MEFNLDELTPAMIQAVWIVFGVRFIIWAFYANSVRKLLVEIAEPNRFLRPNQAWLLIIPFFNIYWNFKVARSVSNSLNNEFYDRKIAEEPAPGLVKGLSYAWMFLLSNIPFPAFLLLTFFMLGLIYFVQYWVKISNFRQLIVEHKRFTDMNEHKHGQKQDHETP